MVCYESTVPADGNSPLYPTPCKRGSEGTLKVTKHLASSLTIHFTLCEGKFVPNHILCGAQYWCQTGLNCPKSKIKIFIVVCQRACLAKPSLFMLKVQS